VLAAAKQRPDAAPARPEDAPRPTLVFEPDPRPNPDPVAPRRAAPPSDEDVDPLAALRAAASDAAERDGNGGSG
jgi:hypothetical protein